MEAKVLKTGKVVEVKVNRNVQPVIDSGAHRVYEDSEGKLYLDTELDFKNVYPDWQQLRIQVSLVIMQGLCSNSVVMQQFDYSERAELAVKQADALIQELQKDL